MAVAPVLVIETVTVPVDLRAMLIEWQRADLQRVGATRRLLGLPPVMTEAEWQRRAAKRDRASSAGDLTDP